MVQQNDRHPHRPPDPFMMAAADLGTHQSVFDKIRACRKVRSSCRALRSASSSRVRFSGSGDSCLTRPCRRISAPRHTPPFDQLLGFELVEHLREWLPRSVNFGAVLFAAEHAGETLSTFSQVQVSSRRQGLGTEMRPAVPRLAFAGLGTWEALSPSLRRSQMSLGTTRRLRRTWTQPPAMGLVHPIVPTGHSICSKYAIYLSRLSESNR